MLSPLGSINNFTACAVFFTHSSGTVDCPPTAPAATSFTPLTVKLLSKTAPLVVSLTSAPLTYSVVSDI